MRLALAILLLGRRYKDSSSAIATWIVICDVDSDSGSHRRACLNTKSASHASKAVYVNSFMTFPPTTGLVDGDLWTNRGGDAFRQAGALPTRDQTYPAVGIPSIRTVKVSPTPAATEAPPPSLPNCNEVEEAQKAGIREIMTTFICEDDRVGPKFFTFGRSAMAVVGIALGRLRSAFTVMQRHRLEVPATSDSRYEVPAVTTITRLVHHSNLMTTSRPIQIITSMTASTLRETNGFTHQDVSPIVPQPFTSVGVLDLPPLHSHSSQTSETSMELVRAHGVLCHEIEKQFKVQHTPLNIGSIRRLLGITESTASKAKNQLSDMFKAAVPDHEVCGTNTGYQTMSESWGVAIVLERQRLLAEIRSMWPDLVERARADVRNRKLFRPSSVAKANHKVLTELIENEVDRILIKRFKL